VRRKSYKENKIKTIFSRLMLLAWLGFVAFASFHLPTFLAQTPIFKIKEIVVEGNQKIDTSMVRVIAEELGKNLLALNEKNIEKHLNKVFAGRVEDVVLKREFSSEGVKVYITLKERRPVAKLKLGASTYLIDKNGVIFKPIGKEGKELVTITTYSLSILRDHFESLYRKVLLSGLPVKEVEIHEDKVILYLGNKEVILPPIDALPANVSRRLKIIYNLKEEKVDLRFGRFILVRN